MPNLIQQRQRCGCTGGPLRLVVQRVDQPVEGLDVQEAVHEVEVHRVPWHHKEQPADRPERVVEEVCVARQVAVCPQVHEPAFVGRALQAAHRGPETVARVLSGRRHLLVEFQVVQIFSSRADVQQVLKPAVDNVDDSLQPAHSWLAMAMNTKNRVTQENCCVSPGSAGPRRPPSPTRRSLPGAAGTRRRRRTRRSAERRRSTAGRAGPSPSRPSRPWALGPSS